jgi:hypothetical protein
MIRSERDALDARRSSGRLGHWRQHRGGGTSGPAVEGNSAWRAASCRVAGRYDEVNLPSLHIGGWYDIFG